MQPVKTTTSALACRLASQLRKSDPSMSLATAMRFAWSRLKSFPASYALVTFTKKSGEVSTRLVLTTKWGELYLSKGTRKLAEDYTLLVDAAKFMLGKHATISAKKDLLIRH